MTKRALILGIAGQDGSYLAEHLLGMNYEVYGVIRRNSTPEHQESRLDHLSDSIKTFYGDITDMASISEILSKSQPDEIYNLAAQSHVRVSFDTALYTADVNGTSVLRLLELVRQSYPSVKLYQASSSEMFGSSVDSDGFQRETTAMTPVSPYGCAKLFGYSAVRNYRHSYRLFASNGILFNHESPRRASNFVTSKVVKSAVSIKMGLLKELKMGNLDSQRDWGHSKDYVEAMQLMLSLDSPGDYVVSTGETRSVRDLCQIVFEMLGLDYRDYVTQDPRYLRPEELPYLCGDSSKFRNISGWKPKISFEQLLAEMVEDWSMRLQK
jgi:GDPmannose 4,6-dehydratase